MEGRVGVADFALVGGGVGVERGAGGLREGFGDGVGERGVVVFRLGRIGGCGGGGTGSAWFRARGIGLGVACCRLLRHCGGGMPIGFQVGRLGGSMSAEAVLAVGWWKLEGFMAIGGCFSAFCVDEENVAQFID